MEFSCLFQSPQFVCGELILLVSFPRPTPAAC